MRKAKLMKWAMVLASGATLLQAPTCTDVATVATGWASVVTAGSVLFLVREILL